MDARLSASRCDVAIVMFDFGPTGVARNALRIARAAAAKGLSVELWVTQDKGVLRDEVPGEVPVVSFGEQVGTNYSRAARRRAGTQAVPRLASLLRERRPAVLLSAGNHFHSFAAKAVREADVDTCLVLRISTGLPRPNRMLNLYRWLRYGYKKRKAERRHGVANRLIAVSREIARELIADMRVDPALVEVIPNGIDQAEIDQLALQPFAHRWFEPGSPPVILGVGRIDQFKNFELLIAAFARLRREGPLRLMILGEERNAWRHRLEAQIERLGIVGDVRFEGFTANPHTYFRRAAAYVCCSRYEGMSNAMLEAMANGCPVIATRTVTGAAELLDDGRLGPLAPNDASALARAIRERIAAPRDGDGLRAQAANYSLDSTLDAYVRLLSAEAGRASPAPSEDPPVSGDALAA